MQVDLVEDSNKIIELNFLKEYIEDNNKVALDDRIKYMIGIVISYLDDFSFETLKEEPFNKMEIKKLKPRKDQIIQELLRRNPDAITAIGDAILTWPCFFSLKIFFLLADMHPLAGVLSKDAGVR